ncbi:MAG: hypothetical protein AAF770_03960 [Bacteroidota bacterium]
MLLVVAYLSNIKAHQNIVDRYNQRIEREVEREKESKLNQEPTNQQLMRASVPLTIFNSIFFLTIAWIVNPETLTPLTPLNIIKKGILLVLFLFVPIFVSLKIGNSNHLWFEKEAEPGRFFLDEEGNLLFDGDEKSIPSWAIEEQLASIGLSGFYPMDINPFKTYSLEEFQTTSIHELF